MRIKINHSFPDGRIERFEIRSKAECGGAMKALGIVTNEEAAQRESAGWATPNNCERINYRQMPQETIGSIIKNVPHRILGAAHDALLSTNRAQVVTPT